MEETTIVPHAALTAASLVPHLERCRYDDTLLAREYDFGLGRVPVAAFAHTPHDARSICIGAVDTAGDPADAVNGLKPLGAPVVFACHAGRLQWWKQTPDRPKLIESVDAGELRPFFAAHAQDFTPATIFEGKTRRRLPGQTQLTFVDAGLMPLLEKRTGEALCRLVDSVIRGIEQSLGKAIRTKGEVEACFKSAFWLLAAKVLRDKRVPNFITLVLPDIDDVFRRVGRHYGDTEGLPPGGRAWRRAIEQASTTVEAYPSLAHVSTESLAYLYENTLIPAEVRKALGTYSTPSALVDYIVWQLWPWIEELPEDRRHIFEPACGHGAFLVAAMRMLRQWSSIGEGKKRHAYLRSHLHGVEIDSFAIEIARLSLTLSDMPHGNSWDLVQADMFTGSMLERRAASCGVLLANPPFSKLSQSQRKKVKATNATGAAGTTPCEMLRRTIPHLTPAACFGVVVPQGLLHSNEGTELRRILLSSFELAEIDVFADNLFEKANHEVAVLLGRRKAGQTASAPAWFRRVRESDIEAFRDRFAFSAEERIEVSRFAASESVDLRVPELDAVWSYLAPGPTLGDIATIGQGISYRGKTLPKNAWTIHDPAHREDALGYANLQDDLEIFATPKRVGMNLDEAVIYRKRAGEPTGKPQVLLNYARVSRQAWRLKTTLDEEGLPLTSRFSAVRPSADGVNAIYLWALLNSPVASAFAYCHLNKRDILVGTMREMMPVPQWSTTHAAQIEQAALRYRELAISLGPLFDASATPAGLKRALLEMDAAVLRAYDLPPRLERQLLDLFTGVERKGVGCDFRGYYPPGFTSHLPLHVLISDRFERAAADGVSERFAASPSPYVRAVLAAAATELDSE